MSIVPESTAGKVWVIAVTMPLSLLGTFVIIFFQGFTLNIVSFGGLALGIGLLVDNSIVVLESIFRKREEGLDPISAAIEGTEEVSSAIIASTLTTLIIFLPLVYIAGAYFPGAIPLAAALTSCPQ